MLNIEYIWEEGEQKKYHFSQLDIKQQGVTYRHEVGD